MHSRTQYVYIYASVCLCVDASVHVHVFVYVYAFVAVYMHVSVCFSVCVCRQKQFNSKKKTSPFPWCRRESLEIQHKQISKKVEGENRNENQWNKHGWRTTLSKIVQIERCCRDDEMPISTKSSRVSPVKKAERSSDEDLTKSYEWSN